MFFFNYIHFILSSRSPYPQQHQLCGSDFSLLLFRLLRLINIPPKVTGVVGSVAALLVTLTYRKSAVSMKDGGGDGLA